MATARKLWRSGVIPDSSAQPSRFLKTTLLGTATMPRPWKNQPRNRKGDSCDGEPNPACDWSQSSWEGIANLSNNRDYNQLPGRVNANPSATLALTPYFRRTSFTPSKNHTQL
jgi:hypothetical protein